MKSLRKHARAALAVLIPVLASCAQDVVYEFPSCVKDSKVIEALTVPSTYGPVGGDRRIRRDLPIGDPRRVPFFRTYLFTTYPEFEPLETATEEQKQRSFAALGDPAVPSTWVIRGNDIDFYLAKDRGAPEESPDGQYWVYPDRVARAGRPSYDRMNYFLPKDTGRSVLIVCQDRGDNSLPTSGPRCTIDSLLTDTPELACISVGFRISPQDLPRWRELNAAWQAKVKSMIRPQAR